MTMRERYEYEAAEFRGQGPDYCQFSRVTTVNGIVHHTPCSSHAAYVATHEVDGVQLGCCAGCAARAGQLGYALERTR